MLIRRSVIKFMAFRTQEVPLELNELPLVDGRGFVRLDSNVQRALAMALNAEHEVYGRNWNPIAGQHVSLDFGMALRPGCDRICALAMRAISLRICMAFRSPRKQRVACTSDLNHETKIRKIHVFLLVATAVHRLWL